MARKTSEFPIVESLSGVFLGRNPAGSTPSGNVQIPLAVLQQYIQQVIASTASNANGAVNFRQAWNATYDYAPNDLVSYNSKVYLMIASSTYISSTAPDNDQTNWLCLFGAIIIATDLNTVGNMSYFYAAGSANTPDSDPYGYGFTILQNNSGIQLFWATDGQTCYVRSCSGNSWTAWTVLSASYQKSQTPSISVSNGAGTVYANANNGAEYYTEITMPTELNIASWPVDGKVSRFRWEIINGGAYAVTFGPYNYLTWVKADGSLTTDFSQIGVSLLASGSNFFEFWSRDGGATVYGRALVG